MSIIIEPYEHKACYYETDQMGVIHHSNYIRWFEEARVDWMEKIGFSYKKLEDMGIIIPVLSAACNYKNAVRFNDTVYIMLTLNEFNGFKLSVTYKVLNKENGMLMAEGETKHCFTKADLTPCRTKRDLPEFYKLFSDNIGVNYYDNIWKDKK